MVNPENIIITMWQGLLGLLDAMRESGVEQLVFSSTAAVYGEPEQVPITEDMPLQPTNVYGRTKLMIEKMMADYSRAYGLRYVALRYFNAAGASLLGNIGEDHRPETHLIPLILQAALGQRESVSIFGTDYPTPDGTCLRDYIHVKDLASAHVLAMDHLQQGGGCRTYNLGTENGFSVREIIETVKKVTGRNFTVKEEARRAGDPAKLIASSEKIKKELHWEPCLSNIEEIVATAWRWHEGHPGYENGGSMDILVTVDGLKKSFGVHDIFQNVSFTVRQGEKWGWWSQRQRQDHSAPVPPGSDLPMGVL